METLGIYGDSFAKDWKHDGKKRLLSEKEWSYHLKKDFNVTNYGLPGSDVHYSYRKFLDTHFKFDKVVFVATDHGRCLNNIIEYNGLLYGMNSIITVEQFKNVNKQWLSDEALLKLQALEYYYTHIYSDIVYKDICRLMLKEIKEIRPDCILISVLPALNQGGAMFRNYQELAVRSLKPDYLETFKKNGYIKCNAEENVYCHLTEEINVLVAQHIKEALVKGKWDPIIPETLFHNHDWDYYYS
jgi:hypothetical protein